MPKLWNDTIDQHRRAVREATMDATVALVAEHGPASVTMSQVAEASGIGRATLYKYFPDVESILSAWHERDVAAHLDQLVRTASEQRSEERRLEAVLDCYALARYQHHHRRRGPDIAAFLHRDPVRDHADDALHRFLCDLLTTGARAGTVRADVPAGELAGFCLHALNAASHQPSKAAVRRLVAVTLDGLRPSPEP